MKKGLPESRKALSSLYLVNRNDFFFVVRAASLTYSVRHHKFSALAALHKVWSTHLPNLVKCSKCGELMMHFTRFGALIFQLALLLSLLAFEDLFFGQIDIGYTSLKFLNKSRTTDILGSSPVSSQSQVPIFRF